VTAGWAARRAQSTQFCTPSQLVVAARADAIAAVIRAQYVGPLRPSVTAIWGMPPAPMTATNVSAGCQRDRGMDAYRAVADAEVRQAGSLAIRSR
jgi:hypothetical protein